MMAAWLRGVQLRKGDEQRREGCFAAALRLCAGSVKDSEAISRRVSCVRAPAAGRPHGLRAACSGVRVTLRRRCCSVVAM